MFYRPRAQKLAHAVLDAQVAKLDPVDVAETYLRDLGAEILDVIVSQNARLSRERDLLQATLAAIHPAHEQPETCPTCAVLGRKPDVPFPLPR